jgi:MarR family transcriptional regulator, lower aerobic nicotinate degradation pathway regulator
VSTSQRPPQEDPSAARPSDEPSLQDLYSRPGFLLRRAHQISVAVFLEEARALGVTTSQYGALFVLNEVNGLDIIGLGRRLGMDRSTSALVVSKLEASGWVAMETDPRDRRRRIVKLTAAGRSILDQLAIPAEQARQRLLSAFTPREAAEFLRLLEEFVATFNGVIRTPIASSKPGRS